MCCPAAHLGVNFACRPRRASRGCFPAAAGSEAASSGDPDRLGCAPPLSLSVPSVCTAALPTADSSGAAAAASGTVLAMRLGSDGTMWPTSSWRGAAEAALDGDFAAVGWCWWPAGWCLDGERAGERECGLTVTRVGDARLLAPARHAKAESRYRHPRWVPNSVLQMQPAASQQVP